MKKNTNPFYDTVELKQNGSKLLDLICENYENIENSPVWPKVEPGFLRNQIPENPPPESCPFDKILEDTQNLIIPGLTLWQHPAFFAYYPSSVSHPAILGEMLTSSFNCPCFTWYASPAATELENIMADWLVKMFALPEKFLLKNQGGGGFINTISDGFFLSVNAAKYRKIQVFYIFENNFEN